ncbi:sugar transferase [Priestia sp. YIM B13448]|uniref:sugar transferase n=1 Tax=Priestia sp. YIM B13448 TaxID=3366308 RepID=UPI00366F3943
MKEVSQLTAHSIRPYKGSYLNYFKVAFDTTFASLALLLSSPILIVVSLLIKFDSKGPIVFKQSRIGLNGKEFKIYKFRTMYTNVPKEGKSPTSSEDARITNIGKFLRKTSLDELPQIINILKGEMSFIGPRPEQKSIVEKHYTDHERQRFLVKPGITGLWQISMDRTKAIHENLQYDFNYIENISLITDLKIIFKTVKVMLKSNTF